MSKEQHVSLFAVCAEMTFSLLDCSSFVRDFHTGRWRIDECKRMRKSSSVGRIVRPGKGGGNDLATQL